MSVEERLLTDIRDLLQQQVDEQRAQVAAQKEQVAAQREQAANQTRRAAPRCCISNSWTDSGAWNAA